MAPHTVKRDDEIWISFGDGSDDADDRGASGSGGTCSGAGPIRQGSGLSARDSTGFPFHGGLRRDDVVDLAVTNFDSNQNLNASILLGNGDGTLQDPVAFNSGTQELTSLTAADLNGDSVADLATTSQGTDDQGPRTPLFSLATATAPSRHPRLMRPAAVRRSSRLRISTETRSRILPPRTQAPTTSRSCSTSRRRRSRR